MSHSSGRIFSFLIVLSLISFFFMLGVFEKQSFPVKERTRTKRIQNTYFFNELKINNNFSNDLCVSNRECDFIALLLYQDHIPWRFSCGIESAALVHPDCGICLYHNDLTNPEDLKLYSHLPNVKYIQMDIYEMFKGTPLDIFFNGEMINNSIFHNKDVMDTARIALLWKNSGGVYFDMDVVFLRRFNEYFDTDTLFQQENDMNSRHAILNGLQVYYPNSYFLELLARRVVGYFKGSKAIWGSMGPEIVTRTYFDALPISKRDSVRIVPREMAFLLHFLDVEKTLWKVTDYEGKKLYHQIMEECVSVHFWRLMFEVHEIKGGGERQETVGRIHKDSLISTIYRENCPVAYSVKMMDIIKQN